MGKSICVHGGVTDDRRMAGMRGRPSFASVAFSPSRATGPFCHPEGGDASCWGADRIGPHLFPQCPMSPPGKSPCHHNGGDPHCLDPRRHHGDTVMGVEDESTPASCGDGCRVHLAPVVETSAGSVREARAPRRENHEQGGFFLSALRSPRDSTRPQLGTGSCASNSARRSC